MSELSPITACVCDSDRSLFLPLAMHLARSRQFKRVLYHTDAQRSFPTVGECSLGSGFEGFDRVDDFWLPKVKNDIELFIFPDISRAGTQLELESQGKIVWGSRQGDTYEIWRELFHKTLEKIGLEPPDNHVCQGLDELWEFLGDKENVWIKVSRVRGTHETTKFRNMRLDEGLLYRWGMKYGPLLNKIRFIVCFEIPTELEIGADTYSIDGKWPSLMLHGLEKKDRAYFSAVTERDKMPDQIQEILDAFGPELAKHRYRNQISFEDRVAKDKHYWIDATQRGGLPSSASQYTAWSNLPEIIYHGAQGEMVDPVPSCKFTAECILTLKGDKDEWGVTEIPPELAEWMNCGAACEVDGLICFHPDPSQTGNEIGWLCATGDTMEEVVENMKGYADALPDGVDADTDALVDLLQEVHEEEKQGIQFSDDTPPEPQTALNIEK